MQCQCAANQNKYAIYTVAINYAALVYYPNRVFFADITDYGTVINSITIQCGAGHQFSLTIKIMDNYCRCFNIYYCIVDKLPFYQLMSQ